MTPCQESLHKDVYTPRNMSTASGALKNTSLVDVVHRLSRSLKTENCCFSSRAKKNNLYLDVREIENVLRLRILLHSGQHGNGNGSYIITVP